jgi:PleD family two-component response regulator
VSCDVPFSECVSESSDNSPVSSQEEGGRTGATPPVTPHSAAQFTYTFPEEDHYQKSLLNTAMSVAKAALNDETVGLMTDISIVDHLLDKLNKVT